jgi:hypothetical protein
LDFPGEKLVTKLWETLAEKGVGSLLTPWQTKRDGKARNEVRRQELLMLAQAEHDAAEVRAGRMRIREDGTLLRLPPPSTIEGVGSLTNDGRIEPTLGLPAAAAAAATVTATDAARREINSARAILFAEEQLASDSQEPPNRPVEDDWLFTWRDYAGRVSNDDLQRLWGSVLAGEVKSPGRHSMRTLEFLKGLSKPEADLLTKLARFVVDSSLIRTQSDYLSAQGLPFVVLLQLQELGVLSGVEAVGLTAQHPTVVPGRFLKALISHDRVLVVEDSDASKVLSIEIYRLTDVGRQVLSLGSFEPDLPYLQAIGKAIAAQGFQVQIAEWRQETETQGRYFNATRIDA